MPTSTLTSKGQITIPKKIRDLLHLRTGQRVEFQFDPVGPCHSEASDAGYYVAGGRRSLPKPASRFHRRNE